ncbi:hypothetical protein GWR56_14685 [Mucilaginibacter sp. 14171R-50]|uniref:hypothetical protein n=1 Tax=Mucilaginibacter sp. 14171R-50 TaxID=2703789 RepID=UPI00138DB71A|nr:hypothetical protein [Mucilaginibacter sp. 14171R-50]QHS56729.1 hypothetical protein GWR56_14685 [Mucilaginibacter sp. 14171R-50]
MRKILLLLCILSITIGAKAQLFGKHYDEGAYYDSVGVKHAGLISWEVPAPSIFKKKGDHIYYKPNKNADDVKINSTALTSFTMRRNEETVDSFVVSQNKKFEKAPFLKVVIANEVKLYSWTTMSQSSGMSMGTGFSVGAGVSGGKTTYFFGNGPEDLTELNKKNFIEIMSQIMANKPEAVARIKNKKLRYGDMDDLLYFYKYDVMPPAQAPDPFSGSNN